jgi:hypothetical protein
VPSKDEGRDKLDSGSPGAFVSDPKDGDGELLQVDERIGVARELVVDGNDEKGVDDMEVGVEAGKGVEDCKDKGNAVGASGIEIGAMRGGFDEENGGVRVSLEEEGGETGVEVGTDGLLASIFCEVEVSDVTTFNPVVAVVVEEVVMEEVVVVVVVVVGKIIRFGLIAGVFTAEAGSRERLDEWGATLLVGAVGVRLVRRLLANEVGEADDDAGDDDASADESLIARKSA